MNKSFSAALVLGLLTALVLGQAGCREAGSEHRASRLAGEQPQVFAAQGVVQELKPGGRAVVIRHGEITNYMAAMTMSFQVRDTNQLAGVTAGDLVTFRLLVTGEESWIDQVQRTGRSSSFASQPPAAESATNRPPAFRLSDVPDFALTNEFGQPVSVRGFTGRVLVLTFFFTRCPVPEYCPRLTRNFQGAIRKLRAGAGGPTNYHFLSISFDPMDSPLLLRAYAQQHHYDSNHWSFLTGHPDHVRELARGFGVPITADATGYDHGFRTAVFDAAGRLQALWPVGGDLTDLIVGEVIKAAR